MLKEFQSVFIVALNQSLVFSHNGLVSGLVLLDLSAAFAPISFKCSLGRPEHAVGIKALTLCSVKDKSEL